MSPKIENAFRVIDRKNFVREEDKPRAYNDHPLPIGHRQTISQPTTVGMMLEWLDPQPGNKILDVGSGSGWTSALLAHLIGAKGSVYGVEKVPELVKFGQDNLKKYGFKNVSIVQAGTEYGLPDEAPFDRILVSAAAKELPQSLVDQLANSGRLVIPIKNSIWLITKDQKGNIDKQEYPGFAFVPLI